MDETVVKVKSKYAHDYFFIDIGKEFYIHHLMPLMDDRDFTFSIENSLNPYHLADRVIHFIEESNKKIGLPTKRINTKYGPYELRIRMPFMYDIDSFAELLVFRMTIVESIYRAALFKIKDKNNQDKLISFFDDRSTYFFSDNEYLFF
jgi:hypothetical protein